MKNLDLRIDTLFKEKTVNNIAVLVMKNDKVLEQIYKTNDGTLSDKSVFDMASVTKTVVTTPLALIALDRGLISLDQKVSDFYNCPSDMKDLKIINILTHTIGYGHKSLCDKNNTYENIADYILNIPIDVPIGSKVLYSCPGYILMGKILEKVFDDRLDCLFKKYVADPLNMDSSSFNPIVGNVINSNLKYDEAGIVNDYNCRFLGGICGNAGLFSDMDDMTKYIKMLINHGKPLFSEKTFDLAVQNYTIEKGESRGLGFVFVDKDYVQTAGLFPVGSIGHCGHTGQSFFLDTKTGFYVIILSDATVSTAKKYGVEKYEEVMQMRHDIHLAIKDDLNKLINVVNC